MGTTVFSSCCFSMKNINSSSVESERILLKRRSEVVSGLSLISSAAMLGFPQVSMAVVKQGILAGRIPGLSEPDEQEIADGSSLTVSRSIRADGNRRGRHLDKNSESGYGDGKKKSQSSGGKLSSQEEILALFGRIRSAISKGEPVNAKNRSLNSSPEKPHAESVLKALLQSQSNNVNEAVPNEEGQVLTQRKRIAGKEESPPEIKFARPPSSFVKKSPIPASPPVQKIEVELKGESLSSGEELDNMKLPALKQLAKSRGIKGYSKLKKAELLELLRS